MDSGNVIELLKYLFLGLVQGITEPIPISSSGHLVLFEHFFGLEISGLSFEVLVNFGSLLAVLFIYRTDLIQLTKNSVSYLVVSDKTESMKKDFYFVLYLIIGTIPAGIIGVLFQDQIAAIFKGVRVIGFTLILTGIALWLIRNLKGSKGDGELTLKDSIIIGLSQAVALIPGISRSGATIVSSMALGTKRETALKFSFFLYIPVSLGAMILSFTDLIHDPNMGQLFLPYTLAFIASLVASYFSLKWFINIMKKGKLGYFSIYCFVVGIAVIILG
ncbi:undecaprenyl-diphosphate phosphatase [Bacillus sp. UMB0728]|uniref:undecaprenyl-diphosphate phosphatase n=1 Tax=Bacillus sp. UMB0728 TaxID=2066052 RepID=UPI000C770920|nr:undecaprenyl-diphosphate phosphatase [Bacillus sp. UMB0728]PLR70260.1 UDP pyrophosphate phosphatase [Bacillus sp. UMB0728]